ncbi:MAG: molybdopterin-dependent oxidoreductase [Burkholderiales bacterium]
MTDQRFPSHSHWGAFTAVVRNGRLIACEPFEHDPHPSPMLRAMPEMVYSPLRIARPAVREGWLKQRESSDRSMRGRDRFIEVSWEQALDLVADSLERTRTRHGAESIFGGSYGWSSAGRLHHARTLARRFLFAGGGCVDQAGNYSWGAAQFFLPHVIGTFGPVTGKVTHWTSIIHHTKLFVAFGGLALKNGQISSGGSGEHTMETWLRASRTNQCEFVVISPTRADCPEFLDAEWIPIRPNTDTALMLALACVLATEGNHDRAFLNSHCVGWDRFEDYLLGRSDGVPKSPAWASSITGIPVSTIEALARRLPRQRTMLSAAWSLQRAHHGEQPYWMMITLASMLGQIGLPGGGFGFGHGSIHGVGNPRPEVQVPELPMGVNPARRSIPVARMADMLLNPDQPYDFNGRTERFPNIRLVYWAGGNPYHHHQDLNRLREAWTRPETIVVHDSWWTATARRADVVFPATTTLERNDVGASGRDRFILAMHQAITPVLGARNDYDIFRELAARLGYEEKFTEGRSEMDWIRMLYDRARGANIEEGVRLPDFDAFWKTGYAEQPRPAKPFILFADFREHPVEHRLATPSGCIEIYSEKIGSFGYADCPPHPTWLPPCEWLGAEGADRHPLHLVTIQPPDRLHAQMDPGSVARAEKIAGREKIRMHPSDAASRGIGAGDVVRVFNDRGACLAGVELDDGVLPSVVVMATGAWYDPDINATDRLDRHGNVNVLSLDIGTSKLTQGPSALSALVQVERWEGALPPMRAFEPPTIQVGTLRRMGAV